MTRLCITVPDLRKRCGNNIAPGVEFDFRGGANYGSTVFLRFLDENTVEVLPVPLSFVNGTRLILYWLWYWLRRIF